MRISALLLTSVLLTACFQSDAATNLIGGCPPVEACSASPVAVAGGHTFTSLAAGRYHTCGRTSTGELWCWGLNTTGQLGAGSTKDSSAIPVKVSGSLSFTAVTAGQFHTCALATDNGVYCWGDNSTAVLGAATTDACGSNPCSRTPIRAAGTTTFGGVAAGIAHTCAIDAGGTTLCWGYNVLGELGNNLYGSSTTDPQTIGGGKTFTKLVSGYRFSCGLELGGALSCWGYGEEGELATLAVDACAVGNQTYRCSTTPVAANTTAKFAQIAAGAAFGCGLTTTNVVLCWGYGGDGALGTGNLLNAGLPAPVNTNDTFTSIAAGYFHACALKSDGTAWCWGANNHAQLGDGTKAYTNSNPQPVAGGKTFTQIVAGANHTCALQADGTAWCWGGDAVAQLGKG